MPFDAKTITRAEMETLNRDDLRQMVTDLVPAYQASKNLVTGLGGDLTRLQLRNEFYDQAFASSVFRESHAKNMEALKDDSSEPITQAYSPTL